MDSHLLPDGIAPLIKIATRMLVAACAVPGSTGPKRVEELTGATAGTISRWQGDAHPDCIIPTSVVFLLEFTLQRPIFARALADLTSHRLVPIAADEAASDTVADLTADLIHVVGSGSRVGAQLGRALEDRKITRREARETLSVIGEHEERLARVKHRLAPLAEDKGA